MFDLLGQVVLAFAGVLQFFPCDLLAGFIKVRPFDGHLEPVCVAMADAALQHLFHVVVDDLGKASELPLDGLRLGHQHFKHPIFHPLREHEVVAVDLRAGLQLAVDAAVALLDAAWVPRQVEVEQVGAVGLKVQPFASGVGGDQDAQRVFCRVRVEATLDFLAPGAANQAVNHLDALLGTVRAFDGLLQNGLQIAFRALAVFGEDQYAAVVPLRCRS